MYFERKLSEINSKPIGVSDTSIDANRLDTRGLIDFFSETDKPQSYKFEQYRHCCIE